MSAAMTKIDTRRPAIQNDLYIRSEELPGTPAIDASGADDIDSNADDLVRQLLVEEKRRTMPERLPEIAPQEDVLVYDAEDPEMKRESARESIAQILKAERAHAPAQSETKAGWLRLPQMRLPRLGLPALRLPRNGTADTDIDTASDARGGIALPNWLRTYRPTRKHIVLAILAALVLYRPLLVPLIALLLIWVVLIAYLTLGPDRWGEILGGAWRRLHERRPELAERVRQRADRFAERFDRFLDLLPEAWAERLALPDFSPEPEDDDRPDPFDRLAAEAREA